MVGTDTATTRRVVSEQAAAPDDADDGAGGRPRASASPRRASVPGYRVAGKTGTAQRVGAECGCYDGTFTVSFAGFAPADDPRFTVYVVVQNPRNGGGGGSVAGPAFSKIMGYALRRYARTADRHQAVAAPGRVVTARRPPGAGRAGAGR